MIEVFKLRGKNNFTNNKLYHTCMHLHRLFIFIFHSSVKFIPTVFNVLETMLIPEISQFLGLCDLNRMWDIMGTCGLSGDGLYEAIKALVNMIIIHQREIE